MQLRSLDAQLMPTAMHPWMHPGQMELWPYEYSAVYRTFDRIFNCQGHGWANLQSVHLNLPFADDEQFGRLHTAIRLILPLLPAIAASSPVVERQVTGRWDNRLDFYRRNSLRVPLVAGQVIPELVMSEQQYQEQILQPMYAQVRPLDPEGILQHEWFNARGAIARFDRGSIEIRLLDLQECPQADLAICALVVGVLRQLVAERWTGFADQQAIGQESLVALLTDCIDRGERAVINDQQFLRQFGAGRLGCPLPAGRLWQHLHEQWSRLDLADSEPWQPAIDHLLSAGTLSSRIVRALQHQSLEQLYAALCRCLAEGRLLGQ
jgi:hypothetical protein